MRAQNDFFRPASAFDFGFGAGGFRLAPSVFLKCALPAALSPPLGSWYAFLTIEHRNRGQPRNSHVYVGTEHNAVTGNVRCSGTRIV